MQFLHITKCAGSAIEAWGKEHGCLWGRHAKDVSEAYHGGGLREPHSGNFKSEWWHVPPRFFCENPYRYADTFAVVRNPYERVISEFRCPWKGFQAPAGRRKGESEEDKERRKAQRRAAAPAQLNEWLQRKLRRGASRPKFRNGHFIPQHMYLFGADGERYVPAESVLHLEQLDDDFARFLRRRNVQPAPLKRVNESEVPRFSVRDLTEETLLLIEECYAEDFELLGYARVSKSSA